MEEPLFAEVKEEVKEEPWDNYPRETSESLLVKEEMEDGEKWRYGGFPTKKKPDFDENTEAKKRKLASVMEDNSYVTQKELNAEVKQEADSFPAEVGQGAQTGYSLLFSKHESDNRVFNAHDFFTNEAMLKEELNEDEEEEEDEDMNQTADDDDSEDEKEKLCPVDGCSEKCDSYEDLVKHMKTHPKPLLCGQCEKQWPTPSRLRFHHRSHSGVRPFKCPTCEKRFTQASGLKTHIRQHTGDRPFGCDKCERKFADASAMRYHKTTHTGEKAFPCTLCSYRSASSGSLTAHMRTHTGEKPFECTECDSCFSRKAHLERHEAAVHAGLKKHSCTECDFKTAYSSHLSRHVKKQHEI